MAQAGHAYGFPGRSLLQVGGNFSKMIGIESPSSEAIPAAKYEEGELQEEDWQDDWVKEHYSLSLYYMYNCGGGYNGSGVRGVLG